MMGAWDGWRWRRRSRYLLKQWRMLLLRLSPKRPIAASAIMLTSMIRQGRVGGMALAMTTISVSGRRSSRVCIDGRLLLTMEILLLWIEQSLLLLLLLVLGIVRVYGPNDMVRRPKRRRSVMISRILLLLLLLLQLIIHLLLRSRIAMIRKGLTAAGRHGLIATRLAAAVRAMASLGRNHNRRR